MSPELAKDFERLRNLKVRKALMQVMAFKEDHAPGTFDLFHQILTCAGTLPQELKGAYALAVAELYQDEDAPRAPEWLKFKAALFKLLKTHQALLQEGDMLLQGMCLNISTARQLGLFPGPERAAQTVIDDGGVRVNAETGEELPDA